MHPVPLLRLLALLVAGSVPALAAAPLPLAELWIGGAPLLVEVAVEEDDRARGLSGREVLPNGRGMLFVYADEDRRAFWMKETPLALDIAFIDARGLVIDIQQMKPLSMELHRSQRPARYVLEVPHGWYARHAVVIGDRVCSPQQPVLIVSCSD